MAKKSARKEKSKAKGAATKKEESDKHSATLASEDAATIAANGELTDEGGLEFNLFKGAKYRGQEGGPRVFATLGQKQNQHVLMKLIRYSIAMFTLPFVSFYILYYYGAGIPRLENENIRLMVSAFSAVLTANVVIAAYVVSAWNEPLEPKPKVGSKKRR